MRAERLRFAAPAAGVLAGIAGLLTFLTIHHFWIRPIWSILPLGLLVAALGGLAVGWSYAEIHSALPPRPWRHIAVAAIVAATLAPGIILAELRSPLADITPGALPPVSSIAYVLTRAAAELLLTATVAGAAIGWLLARTRRAALATGLAGFIFALGPGHNIPFLGGTPVAGKGIVLLAAIIAVAALVLVECHARLAGSAGQPA